MPTQKTHVDYNNVPRCLGLKKREGSNAKAMAFAPTYPIIPVADWKPKIYKTTIPIYDQGMRGSCVGNGSSTMVMKCRELANQPFNLLSPIFLYDQINRGIDQGSDPADAMAILQSIGICLNATVGQDATLNKNKLPQDAYIEAKRFIIPEGAIYKLNTFEELVTAFLSGFKCGITINVGSVFNLDANGVVSYTPGQGNHWVSIGDTLKQITSASHSPIWALEFTNSWSINWGDKGKAFITKQHIEQENLEMYAIKYVSDDPLNIPKTVSSSTVATATEISKESVKKESEIPKSKKPEESKKSESK